MLFIIDDFYQVELFPVFLACLFLPSLPFPLLWMTFIFYQIIFFLYWYDNLFLLQTFLWLSKLTYFMRNQHYMPGVNYLWSWHAIDLLNYSMWFNSILIETSVYLFMRHSGLLIFSFILMFYVVSVENELENITSDCVCICNLFNSFIFLLLGVALLITRPLSFPLFQS